MIVPKASRVQTPARYGAERPNGAAWPVNAGATAMYTLNKLYATVQGEGSMTGRPMVIVRLQGCPVGCVFCDTPESWRPNDAMRRSATEIANDVAATRLRWALVTGGEPCWHDLKALTQELGARHTHTALETSGVYPITGEWDWITVSPKPAGYLPINSQALARANEIKWLVGREADITALETTLETFRAEIEYPAVVAGGLVRVAEISVQPISCNRRATELCVRAVLAHPEWRLSVQTHKLIGIA